MILTHNYWYFKSEIPVDVCNRIIDMGLEKESRVGYIKGLTGDETDAEKIKEFRDSNVSWLSDRWIYELMQTKTDEANQRAGWNFEWDWCEDMQFTIYKPGQYYHWHADQSDTVFTEGNYKGKYRKLTTILHLSDPKDFEGGELEIDLGRLNGTKLCPELRPQGSIVVFPSFVHHRVHPVVSGTRYSLVMWTLGNPFR